MSRAIDLFVTYRFIKLLTTPYNKMPAFKMGLIDKNGYRTDKEITTSDEKSAYTTLNKLILNIKRIFAKVPGLKSKVGTYAAALYLLKDTFKEEFTNIGAIENHLLSYLKENNIEFDDTIVEEIQLEENRLPKGTYILTHGIMDYAFAGDQIEVVENARPLDTIIGMCIYPAIHTETRKKVFISLDSIIA